MYRPKRLLTLFVREKKTFCACSPEMPQVLIHIYGFDFATFIFKIKVHIRGLANG